MITTYFPSYTYGEDALFVLPDLVKNCKRILIAGGRTALQKSKNKIEIALKNASSTKYEYHWYGGECNYKNITALRKKIETGGFDMVVGVGGGKALDTCKAAADLAQVEIITIPTIASTCAAATALSVVYDDDGTFLEVMYLKRNSPNIFL